MVASRYQFIPRDTSGWSCWIELVTVENFIRMRDDVSKGGHADCALDAQEEKKPTDGWHEKRGGISELEE